MPTGLTINFTNQSTGAQVGGSVIIEPADLKDDLDHVSKMDAVKFMASKLYGTASPDVNCIRGGRVVMPIYVYPFPITLAYQLNACCGQLTPAQIEHHEVSEILDFSGGNRKSPKYPVMSMLSTEWQGDVFDQGGAVIPAPTITLIDGDIVLSGDAVANLEIRYLTARHVHNLTLTDGDLIGGKYTDWIYAVWSGGVEWKEIMAPPCVDVADDEFECGWGHGRSRTTINGGDDDDLPIAYPDDRTIDVEYCTQQVE